MSKYLSKTTITLTDDEWDSILGTLEDRSPLFLKIVRQVYPDDKKYE